MNNLYTTSAYSNFVEELVKLRFKVKGVDVECEGDVDEINRILSELFTKGYVSEVKYEEDKDELSLKKKIPSQEVLIKYITSKPNFEHDIFEIQEHFFGRRFSSHGSDEKKYNALYRRLVRVREKIEKEFGGKFVGEWKQSPTGEPYKVFRFIKKMEGSN